MFLDQRFPSLPPLHAFNTLPFNSFKRVKGKYLGFPLLTGRVRKSDFGYILDKVNSRLAGWKGKLLNRTGRVTLAKSVIAAIPVYSMHNFWLPWGICDSLDACVRRFIWGGNTCHWVNWKNIIQRRSKRGLGIHTARESNTSLIGKHIWDLIHNHDKLWVQLLSSKCLKGTHILDVKYGASYVWNSILKTATIIKFGFKHRIGKMWDLNLVWQVVGCGLCM